MIFLSSDELAIINNLNKIRSTTVLNGVGNKTTKRVFLNGLNLCRLERATLKKGRSYYFELEFLRKPEYVFDRKEYFANLVDYVFEPHTRIAELLFAFGHELKPMPEGYDVLAYLRAVLRRVNTFIGRELKVAVFAYNDIVRDEYGNVEKVFCEGTLLDKEATRTEVLGYYAVDTKQIDWSLFLR